MITNEQLAEASRFGVAVDGRWSGETLDRMLQQARDEARKEDARWDSQIDGMSAAEIADFEHLMQTDEAQHSSGYLCIYLDFDVWIGERRVRARKEPIFVPYDRARSVLVDGKARRAPPPAELWGCI